MEDIVLSEIRYRTGVYMTENKRDILNNKWYLYLTEFFTGMAVMAVELGASRLLAPFFSSSQIVWTIIIGTIMIAMALGNVIGGRWADKSKDPSGLFKRILIAAVWIGLIPALGKYVILAITGLMIVTIDTNLLIWASFFACMIIFVFPLFLLGTVTPSLIKFGVKDLDESGRVAGKLGACNTIGSIIGTFLPTFVTIPAMGTAITFLIFSAILLILAIIYFVVNGGGKKAVAIASIIFILGAVFGNRSNFAFWNHDLTYEGESVYNYLQVYDTPDKTVLSTNVLFGVQSVYMKNDSLTGMYYDYALASTVLAGKENPKILVLGMGTGTFASQCKYYFPGADITGVEIDDKITDLARTYFNLDPSIPVVTYDGRAYLNAVNDKYDIIMVDAYQDITIPFQMSSKEFFTLVREHLTQDGVMVVNMNMHGSSGEDDITSYLTDTIASVFDDVIVADVDGSTNRELFASNGASQSLNERMDNNLLSLPMDPELRTMLEYVRSDMTTVDAGSRILTDDKAPVELIGMKTIDTLIQDEVAYYKQIYKEEGLKGLLEEM